METLTALDMVVLLLVGGGALFGAFRGFVTEVLSLFAWVAAVIAVKLAYTPAAALLAGMISSPMAAAVLAFALVFGVTFVIGKLVAGAVGRRTRTSVLGPIDRLLGATLLFLLANLATDTVYGGGAARPEWMRASRTFPLLNASSRAIVDFVAARRAMRAERSE